MDLLIKCGKAILFLLSTIWAYNTFYAYCAAIEKFDEKEISKRSFNLFIWFSVIGFVAFMVYVKLM